MRSKKILSIVAFVAAFGLSTAFAGLFIVKTTNASNASYKPVSYCKFKHNSTSEAISSLIVSNYANAKVRDSKIYDIGESYPPSHNSVEFADYAQNIEEYVNASSSLRTDGLPRDFRQAWQKHIKAWRDYSNFMNKTADVSTKNSFTPEEIEKAEAQFNQQIDQTYDAVLEIGGNYGADFR